MSSVICNEIGPVFLPVRDVVKARAWYSRLLGLTGEDRIHFGHLCTLSTKGANLVLDQMPLWQKKEGPFRPYEVPALAFKTRDIHEAYAWMKEEGVELVTEVLHNHFFIFKDPDGNHLMIEQ